MTETLSDKINIKGFRTDEWFQENIWEDDLDENEIVALVLNEVSKDVKEFIKQFKEQIDEWEYYEKRFPQKETKWNRLKMRIDKLAGDKLV